VEKVAVSIHRLVDRAWIPACAGMTNIKNLRLPSEIGVVGISKGKPAFTP